MRPISSSRSSRRAGLSLPLCLALAVSAITQSELARPAFAQAQPSAGDIAQARELLNQGLDLRNQGNASAALDKLKAAYALAHTPIIGMELGRTYATLGQLVEARETFLSVSRTPARPEETQRSNLARVTSDQLADQLRPRIPSLTVRITGVPAETLAVTIDGVVVPVEALAAPRLINPGRHVVAAKSTSGGAADATVDLKEGDAREVELKLVFTGAGASHAAVTPTPTPASDAAAHGGEPGPSEPRPHSRVLPWALVGGGAAVGAAGVVLMIVEAGKAGDANAQHDRAAYDAVKTPYTIGLVGAIVGGAAIAAGGLVFVLQSQHANGREATRPVWIGVGPEAVRVGGAW
jgi:hypothetical protein